MGRTKASRRSAIRQKPNERKELLRLEVAKLRARLAEEMGAKLEAARQELPPALLQMKLRDFILLSEKIQLIGKDKRRRRTSIAALLESTRPIRLEAVETGERRLTRSAVARASIVPTGQTIESTVPATPKFHPALPETPAAYRRAAAPAVPAFAPPAAAGSSAPLRITRSTIRVVNHDPTPFDASSSKPAKKKADPVVGMVSLELGNGETFDLDLTRSPRTLLSTLGSDALREVKQKMQTYASQLRSFFGKLQV